MWWNIMTNRNEHFDPRQKENLIPDIVSENPSGQYWSEGIYISLLYILIAICFQCSFNIVSSQKYVPRSISHKFPFNIVIQSLRFLLTLFFFAAAIHSMVILFNVYSSKVGWYDP